MILSEYVPYHCFRGGAHQFKHSLFFLEERRSLRNGMSKLFFKQLLDGAA